ncbi:hypothetical protein IWX49DRAFT_160155 [Phyllosticta citricarpa]|uniref:Transmembrane protein n=2 Tax=Phyllosticta TaxID=121621 RepID=A0ABR1M6F3_9PEZI
MAKKPLQRRRNRNAVAMMAQTIAMHLINIFPPPLLLMKFVLDAAIANSVFVLLVPAMAVVVLVDTQESTRVVPTEREQEQQKTCMWTARRHRHNSSFLAPRNSRWRSAIISLSIDPAVIRECSDGVSKRSTRAVIEIPSVCAGKTCLAACLAGLVCLALSLSPSAHPIKNASVCSKREGQKMRRDQVKTEVRARSQAKGTNQTARKDEQGENGREGKKSSREYFGSLLSVIPM